MTECCPKCDGAGRVAVVDIDETPGVEGYRPLRSYHAAKCDRCNGLGFGESDDG